MRGHRIDDSLARGRDLGAWDNPYQRSFDLFAAILGLYQWSS
tara:strand:- start:252 stop:377 length:126 start_codon:yes stop_codon:yes gene_type:complete